MRRLLSITAVLALVTAKPELYRENEDFQYSRTSSDEGHKAGYYGAQRGNMGLNYEKSHNMDLLAQHHMSGAIRQVEGELGDAADTKSGSVFTSAKSGGVFGSSKYDTSNLAGRNFHEGVNYGDSNSHASMSSHYTGAHHSGYTGGYGHNSGYHEDTLHSGNLQAVDTVGAGGYDYEHKAEHSSGYQKQSGYTKQSSEGYGSNAYTGSNTHTRMVGNGVPARVVIRPGTTVYVPVAAQTYQHAPLHDQNAIDTDAEVLSSADHHGHYSPSTDTKNYESSYSYRKEWEKHHEYPSAVPLVVPTMSPFPKNSELYEDAHGHSGSHNALSSGHYDRYNSNVKSSSAMQSQHHSGYNAAHDSSSSLSSNAHTHGALNSDIGYAGDVSSKPKSYQSSYAYHKSWERQGDPYVIIPSNDGQTHGKITDASDNGKLCCVDSDGHIRVVRSNDQNQETENFNQQSQNIEDLGQQTQDLTQQSMSKWNEHLEDFGQQTQDLTQQSISNWNEHLEDLGQQTQDLTQQSQTNWKQNMEDLSHQTQTSWKQNLQDFGQQTQDLTQQSQTNWKENLENLGQQTQDLTQQTQANWNQNLENLGQQTQDFGQQTENRWNKFTASGQQTESQQSQDTWSTPTSGDEEVDQNSHNSWKLDDFGQSMQGSWHHKMNGKSLTKEIEFNTDSDNLNNFHRTTLNSDSYEQQNNWHQAAHNQDHDLGQETQSMWHKWDISNQNNNVYLNSQVKPVWEQTEDIRPQFSDNSELDTDSTRHSNPWKFSGNHQQNISKSNQTSETYANNRTELGSQGTSLVNLWNKINNLDQFSMSENNQNGYQYSHNHRTLDNSFQNNWSHTFSRNDSGLTQSTLNHYGSHYGEFKPMWNSNTLNQNSSTDKDTDSMTQNTYNINPFGDYQEREATTTTRPDQNAGTRPAEASRPQDIGRGDIGPEESSVHGLTTNTKPQVNTNYNINASTGSYSFENKRFKTPEEIETLSLTTHTEKINRNKNTSSVKKNFTDYNNQHVSDSNLSVLSLQEWIDEQRKQDKNEYDTSGTLKISRTTPKTDNIYNNVNFSIEKFESHHSDSQSENTLYYNKPTTTTKPNSASQLKPKDVTDRTSKDMKHLHEGTDMGQETQQLDDFRSFIQENKNLKPEFNQQNQQFESPGQFGKQSDNSDQQVQSLWGHDLVDLGQQQQSGWESRDYVQETQQLEKSRRFNEGQYQTQDFYNQRYTIKEKEHEEKTINEDIPSPQLPEKLEIQKKNDDTEIAMPPVPSTEKPGFWKSVGSKLSGAKDTVTSWFKKS